MFITEHYFRCAGRWSLLPLDIARLLTNQLLTVASHLSYRRREWYLDFNLGKKETKHISQNVKTISSKFCADMVRGTKIYT